MRLLKFILLCPLASVIVIAGVLPWVEQINLQKVQAGKMPSTFFFKIPVMEKPQAEMAFGWLQGKEFDDELVEFQMERALKARPLYPDNWLLLAKVKHKLGKHEEAYNLAKHAQELAPTRAYMLWNLAMFWLSYPDTDKAISTLHDYLLAKPNQVHKVLVTAYRLDNNKAQLIDKLIPTRVAKGYEYDLDYYPAQVLNSALRFKNLELAKIAWSKITNREIENNLNAKVIQRYLGFLIAQNKNNDAKTVWNEIQGDQPNSDQVLNAGFENPLLNYGFGWRTSQKKGVLIERSFDESVEGDYSLKISLDGTENINLYHPTITLPVEEGQPYQLSIFWKGDQITTRSNPFLEIYYKDGEKNKSIRSKPKRGSWDWTRENLEFEVPMGTHFINFRLRRWRTQALDKLIAGTLYLDELKLTRYN